VGPGVIGVRAPVGARDSGRAGGRRRKGREREEGKGRKRRKEKKERRKGKRVERKEKEEKKRKGRKNGERKEKKWGERFQKIWKIDREIRGRILRDFSDFRASARFPRRR
jgi:hypothetical protein